MKRAHSSSTLPARANQYTMRGARNGGRAHLGMTGVRKREEGSRTL